jgi:Sec-independent protein secretion pathway component TatC
VGIFALQGGEDVNCVFCALIFVLSSSMMTALAINIPSILYSIWFVISKYYAEDVGGD